MPEFFFMEKKKNRNFHRPELSLLGNRATTCNMVFLNAILEHGKNISGKTNCSRVMNEI